MWMLLCPLRKRRMTHKHLLSFLAVMASDFRLIQEMAKVISQKDWDARRLDKTTMEALGLKGSPKLSKILMSAGVPKRTVDLALSGAKPNPVNGFCFKSDLVGAKTGHSLEWLMDQGVSNHYGSCQYEGGLHDDRSGDIEHWENGNLLMWVIGNPVSVDGEGYIARAKVRVMYRVNGSIGGLYVDRPYGQFAALLEETNHLAEMWKKYSGTNTPLFFPPVWNRNPGAGANFQSRYGGTYHEKLTCPSSTSGYQDTMKGGHTYFDFFNEVKEDRTAIFSAYTARSKTAGVYTTPLTSVVFNSQKWEMIAPERRVEPKPMLSAPAAKALTRWGFEKVHPRTGRAYKNGVRFVFKSAEDAILLFVKEDEDGFPIKDFFEVATLNKKGYGEICETDFFDRVEDEPVIPNDYGLVVVRESVYDGFAVAQPLP